MKKAQSYIMVPISIVLCGVFIVIMWAFGGLYPQKGDIPPDVNKEESSFSICIIKEDGSIRQMDLEEYVARVVLGEVPATYHMEALKAQAVAARTYTLYWVITSKKHIGAAVCTDHRCCQAYCEPEDYFENGGTSQGIEKIWSAVEATKGEVLFCGNEIICATYFACSGGKTEDAETVWGEKYPYLKSVIVSAENTGCDMQEIRLTKWELEQYLGVDLSGTPEQWFGFKLDTGGSGVALLRIGGKLYTGVELRKALNLKSTIINMNIEKEEIIILTKGYGHRVGMSQHGANAMARAGETYEKILMQFYTDVILKPYIPQQ